MDASTGVYNKQGNIPIPFVQVHEIQSIAQMTDNNTEM